MSDITPDAPAWERSADQSPFLPGTSWLVDGHVFHIDASGRPVEKDTGARPQLCWTGCTHHHSVQQLFLTLEAVGQAWDPSKAGVLL